jgi:hypothetical protein
MTVMWDMEQVQASPFFAALRPVLDQAHWPQQHWPALTDYQTLLDHLPHAVCTASGAPLRVVVPRPEKSPDWRDAYEARIYLRGELPTRVSSWHDCFNLLTWAAFPRSKAALNALHFALLEARAESLAQTLPRTPRQDALTQFDESGVIVLCADSTLITLMRNFEWKTLFWERRHDVLAHMRCFLFGHGLMEKALIPYPGMTGKAVLLLVPPSLLALPLTAQLTQVDERVAELIADGRSLLQPRDLAPLPLLGFPGFTPENECAAYYDDQRYFRPGRRAAGSK